MSAVILLTSSALALFYLQATCEATLRREFDSSRLCGLVNAYRLEFSSVRSELQTIGISIDYGTICEALKCDYLVVTYLLRNSGRSSSPWRERLLMLYFRAALLLLSTQTVLKFNGKWAVFKLLDILNYLAIELSNSGETHFSTTTG